MNDVIRQKFDEEIEREIDGLAYIDQGSEDHSQAVENVTRLYKLSIEEDKNLQESKERSKSRWFGLGISVVSLLLPMGFNWALANKGFKFEETGAICSTTFRNLFNGMFNKLGIKK